MSGFLARLLALAAAFVAGWLFSNEVRAPLLENMNLAVWALVGFMGAVMMAIGR